MDEITTQDHRFFLMGMDLKNGEVVYTQQFHPKPHHADERRCEQQQKVAPAPFAPDDPFANPPVFCCNESCDEIALHHCKRCSMKLCTRCFRHDSSYGLCDICFRESCTAHVTRLGRMSR